MAQASVDITIPVLNEERAIEESLRTLAAYLSTECPYDWCITVVDNGSADKTWELANAYGGVRPADSSVPTRSARARGCPESGLVDKQR